MRALPFVSCLLLAACTRVPETRAELDARLSDRADAHTRRFGFAPGLAVAVVEDGEEVTRLVRGDEAPFSGVPVTGGTPFLLASTTKIVTSVVVMQLVDEGLLSLDDRVTDHVAGLPSSWSDITLEHLLTHTDGLPDPLEHPALLALDREEARALPPEAYVAFAAELEPNFAAGEQAAYGQTGFVLLSMAVASVAGAPFADVVEARVIDAVGMPATGFALDHEIHERDGDGARTVPIAYWGPDIATAAMVSSLDDLVALVGALHRGELLSDAAWESLSTPSPLTREWGLGVQIWDEAGQQLAGHSGGWSVVLAFVPETRVATVSLSNASDRRILDLGYDVARTGALWGDR